MVPMKINKVLNLEGTKVTYLQNYLDFTIYFCVSPVITVLKLVTEVLWPSTFLQTCFKRTIQDITTI